MATSKTIPIVRDSWDGYSYPYGNGLMARVQFDVVAASEKSHAGFGKCMRVILFVDERDVRRDGLPATTEVMQRLLLAHKALTDELWSKQVSSLFVGSMLYGGMFDLVFQVEANSLPRFKAVAEQFNVARIGFRSELRESDGWAFFDAKLKPSVANAQQIEDRRVIAQLVSAGSDPSQVHRLQHVILGPADALKQIGQILAKNGFTQARFVGEGRLEVETESTLDLFQLWGFTGNLAGLCARVGARYDGWGTSVTLVRPNGG